MRLSNVARMTFVCMSCILLAACGTAASTANTPPKPTATSTPTIPYLGQSADQILATLKSKGLPVGTIFAYTAANDPNNLLGRPGQYISKDNFKDTRISSSDTGVNISVGDGGAVETFASSSDAQKRFAYLQSLSTSGNALFAEYEYLDGAAILRLSSQLTPDEAKAYETAFKSV